MRVNSFTLFETIICVTILTIIVVGFKYSTIYENNNLENFFLLNDLENKFDNKDYSIFTKSSETIKLIKNKKQIEEINVNKFEYLNKDIRLFKYEK